MERMGLGTRLMLEIVFFSSAPFSMMGKPHFEGKSTLCNTSRKELQHVSQALGHAELEQPASPGLREDSAEPRSDTTVSYQIPASGGMQAQLPTKGAACIVVMTCTRH